MMNDHLNILMLEDDDVDAQIVQMYLKESQVTFSSTVVSTRKDFVDALEHKDIDVILSDHNLPLFTSLEALKIRNQEKLHIPFILLSGTIREESAVKLLHEGANDYILKDRLQRLPISITESIKKQKRFAEKIKAEKELLDTVERLHLVGEATSDAIWDWNIRTSKVVWNKGFEQMFGYKLNNLQSSLESWVEHLYPDDKEKVVSGIMDVINTPGKEYWMEEYRYIKADGEIVIVLDKGIVLRDETGKAYRMVGAMQDITHIRQIENELFQEKLSRQREIAETIIQAQEKERTEIGKELHDNVNQLLASIKIMIEVARSSPEMRDTFLDKSMEAIKYAITEVRNISHSMITPSLKNGSFSNALYDLIDNLNLSGKISATVIWTGKKDLNGVSDDIKLSAYRIIQEQTTNVLKHANASELEIEIKKTRKLFEITVKDNGIGFDPSIKKNGIGLSNIRNRAEIYNGTLDVNSSLGKGCALKVKFTLT